MLQCLPGSSAFMGAAKELFSQRENASLTNTPVILLDGARFQRCPSKGYSFFGTVHSNVCSLVKQKRKMYDKEFEGHIPYLRRLRPGVRLRRKRPVSASVRLTKGSHSNVQPVGCGTGSHLSRGVVNGSNQGMCHPIFMIKRSTGFSFILFCGT